MKRIKLTKASLQNTGSLVPKDTEEVNIDDANNIDDNIADTVVNSAMENISEYIKPNLMNIVEGNIVGNITDIVDDVEDNLVDHMEVGNVDDINHHFVYNVHYNNEDIESNIVNSIKDKIVNIEKDVFGSFKKKIADYVENNIVDIETKIMNRIKTNILDYVKNKIVDDIRDKIVDIQNNFNKILTDHLQQYIVNYVQAKIVDIQNNIVNNIKNNTVDKIQDSVNDIEDNIVNTNNIEATVRNIIKGNIMDINVDNIAFNIMECSGYNILNDVGVTFVDKIVDNAMDYMEHNMGEVMTTVGHYPMKMAQTFMTNNTKHLVDKTKKATLPISAFVDEAVTASSIVAFAFHGGVIVGTDTLLHEEPLAYLNDHTRFYKLHDYIFCAGTGRFDEMQQITHSVKCSMEMFQFGKHYRPLLGRTARKMMLELLLEASVYIGSFVIFGVDEGGLYMSSVHMCGATEMLPYCTMGYDDRTLLPLLEDCWRPDIRRKEAIELLTHIFRYGLRPTVFGEYRLNISVMCSDGSFSNITRELSLTPAFIRRGLAAPKGGKDDDETDDMEQTNRSKSGVKRKCLEDAPFPNKKQKFANSFMLNVNVQQYNN